MLAVWRQHVSSPLCCSPSVASNFSSSPPPLCSTRFLLCAPPYAPLHSRALISCTLHLHHHIRPVLFLRSSLIYILPSPSFLLPHLRLPPSCFSHCVLRCLGHSQLLKKASACDGLYGIAYLVHYSQYTHFSKHNYIQIIPAESQWMSALLADVKGWVKASDVCQAVCDQCTNNSTSLLAEGVQVHRCWTRCVCQTGLFSHCYQISLTQHPH